MRHRVFSARFLSHTSSIWVSWFFTSWVEVPVNTQSGSYIRVVKSQKQLYRSSKNRKRLFVHLIEKKSQVRVSIRVYCTWWLLQTFGEICLVVGFLFQFTHSRPMKSLYSHRVVLSSPYTRPITVSFCPPVETPEHLKLHPQNRKPTNSRADLLISSSTVIKPNTCVNCCNDSFTSGMT